MTNENQRDKTERLNNRQMRDAVEADRLVNKIKTHNVCSDTERALARALLQAVEDLESKTTLIKNICEKCNLPPLLCGCNNPTPDEMRFIRKVTRRMTDQNQKEKTADEIAAQVFGEMVCDHYERSRSIAFIAQALKSHAERVRLETIEEAAKVADEYSVERRNSIGFVLNQVSASPRESLADIAAKIRALKGEGK